MDRRSRKTRAQLMQAIIRLMQSETWEDLSVRAICDGADIARSTFYLHFAGKAELLDYAFRYLGEEMRAVPTDRSLDQDGRFAILPALVRMMGAQDHGFLFKGDGLVQSTLLARDRLRHVIHSELQAEINASERYLDFPDHRLAFIASGVFGSLEAAHELPTLNPEDLLEQIERLVGALLEVSP